MTSTLVDCSSPAEYEKIQARRWFKYKEPVRYFRNCGLVDPHHIELIKIGTEDMTVGEIFTLLKDHPEYIPLNRCMSDFIHQNPTNESIVSLLSNYTDRRDLFFFGSMFQNYKGTEAWVLSINYNRQGSATEYLKRHLSERWYPDYYHIAVIRKS